MEARRLLPNEADGDPDPISAGTAGEAALWGGSSAAVGMAANPFGAHQADLDVSCAQPGASVAASPDGIPVSDILRASF